VEIYIDETRLILSSGNGGAGCVAFRREKYVERGGPNGGDGGRGGHVIFRVKPNLRTFAHFNNKHKFLAATGKNGMGSKMHGANGDDLILEVPPGTVVRDEENGDILHDFNKEQTPEWKLLEGGRGGLGNWHFRSARRQVPRFAQPGGEGATQTVRIELRLIADVGLVGFPNAGKSSLLTAVTQARPQIADYPFTTKRPHLGVMKVSGEAMVMADIPGLIKGASEGLGLGHRFLKHISRTGILLFLIDIGDENFLEAYDILLNELAQYSEELVKKPRLVFASKSDLDPDGSRLAELRGKYSDLDIHSFSVYERTGLDEASIKILSLVKK